MSSRRDAGIPGLIGVLHLPALAGAPGARGLSPSEALARAGLQAVAEAKALAQAGFEGLILENFGDSPFLKGPVGPETVASLAVIAAAVREAVRVPIGINVLRNDGPSALAIAAVTGCDFIRVNVLSGVAATDQGLIEGEAARLARERDRLEAQVSILADAHVKHAQSLSSRDIELAVEELGLRALADGVIVTGATTGRPVDAEALRRAGQAARHHGIPLWIGSGATRETLPGLLEWANGIIVGSAIRKGGRAGAPLDLARLKAFVKDYRAASRRRKPKPAAAAGTRKPGAGKRKKKKSSRRTGAGARS